MTTEQNIREIYNILQRMLKNSSGSVTTTETNSAAILAAILDLALPTEDQNSLIRFIKGGNSTTVEDTVPLPVELSSASGPINITAGDLNVQLSHLGANFDSTRIGDGINLLGLNTDGSIKDVNVLSKYKYSRADTTTSTEYYGFIYTDGSWYILKNDTTTEEATYSNGANNFLTNWGNRATTLVFYEFNNLTW